jgi:chemotaxis protein histidine kinase CheA
MKKRLYAPEKCELSQAEINHLRRLLAWLRCENAALYLEPEQHLEVAQKLSETLNKEQMRSYEERIVKAFNRWPKYVHDAVRALGKTIHQIDGNVTDAEFSEQRELAAPKDATP